MKKGLIFVSVMVMLVLCFIPVDAGSEVKIQHNLSAQHPWQKGMTYIKEQVEAKTKGSITMTIYPNGILADQSWANILEQTQKNIVQMTAEATIPWSSLVPELFAFNTPFMFNDMDHLVRFLDKNPPVINKWFQKLEKFDLVVLAVWPRDSRQLLNSKKPITSPKDIAGMKFRVPGIPYCIKTFEAFGAKPVPLPTGEIYTAMQLGTVDGEDNSVGHVYDTKTFEVGKYMNIWDYMADAVIVVGNKKWFNSLTKNEQDIIRQAAIEARSLIYKEESALRTSAIEKMKKSGIKFTYYNEKMKKPFIAKMDPVYNELKKVVGEEDWNSFVKAVKETK